MLKVGFIGLGGMGRYQAKAFAQVRGCQVVAGADISEESRRQFAEEFPAARVFANHHDLLRDPGVDAVVVAPPTLYHRPITIDALAAKKPVLVEKPMGRTVADCRAMIEASRRHRTLLMVAHCRRFDPGWGAWAKLATPDKLGEPVLWRHVNAGFAPGAKWFLDHDLSGGPLMDGAVHNYDFANMLWGDPEYVIASAVKLDKSSTGVDTGTAVVQYRNGNQLALIWSWAMRGGNVFDLLGPKASLQLGHGHLPAPPARPNRVTYCYTTADRKSKLLSLPASGMTMYANQARHFLACVRGKSRCQSGPETAIKAVAVADAVLRSAQQNRRIKVKW